MVERAVRSFMTILNIINRDMPVENSMFETFERSQEVWTKENKSKKNPNVLRVSLNLNAATPTRSAPSRDP